MAGGQERVLRRRIKSIQSTQKITRAQELIAASRIVRAQGRVHAAQPYSDSITEVVSDLASGGGTTSALLVPRPEVRNVAHIVIAADRGLCGAYNSNVLRTAEMAIAATFMAKVAAMATTARNCSLRPRWCQSGSPRLEHGRGCLRRSSGNPSDAACSLDSCSQS